MLRPQTIYTGQFNKNGEYEGKGDLFNKLLGYTYKGTFKNGLFEGEGFLEGTDLDYKGGFRQGVFHGYGEKYFKGGIQGATQKG